MLCTSLGKCYVFSKFHGISVCIWMQPWNQEIQPTCIYIPHKWFITTANRRHIWECEGFSSHIFCWEILHILGLHLEYLCIISIKNIVHSGYVLKVCLFREKIVKIPCDGSEVSIGCWRNFNWLFLVWSVFLPTLKLFMYEWIALPCFFPRRTTHVLFYCFSK